MLVLAQKSNSQATQPVWLSTWCNGVCLAPGVLTALAVAIQAAEDAWNTRDPERVSLAYTEDSVWRNRAEFFTGREKIREFLTRKWNTELDYRLKKELWSFTDNRISVKFEYEYHTDSGQWYRAYGNEQWEFAENGLMRRREASINDLPIQESERKFRWERISFNRSKYPTGYLQGMNLEYQGGNLVTDSNAYTDNHCGTISRTGMATSLSNRRVGNAHPIVLSPTTTAVFI